LPVGALDEGDDPGVEGDTGTSGVGGKVSELVGFGFGACGGGIRGGTCAATAVANSSRTAGAAQQERIVFMCEPKSTCAVSI
jgi:hypothetical protein